MLSKKELLKKFKSKLEIEEKNKEQLYNILINKDIVKSINDNIDTLLEIIPEIKDMIGFPHNHPHHHLDVWNHTLLALSLSDMNFEIRLCLLLHDIGKPHCYQDREVRHFKGHPKESASISKKILKRLKYDKEYINEVCYLIEKHDSGITEKDIISNYDLEYKRYLMQYCDTYAHHPDKIENRVKYLNAIKFLLYEYQEPEIINQKNK